MLKSMNASFLMLYVAGVPEFKFFSPVMAYSACVFLVKVFTVYKIIRNVALPKIARQEDFISTVLNWLIICSALLCIVSPILLWLDSHKVSLHIKKWLQFQVTSNYILFIVIII
jgi:hypothetical protein